MMYKFLLPLLLICFHSFAQDVTTGKWLHATIDGNKKEWGPLNFYDNETQLNFGLANDSNNIYLCFQTVNETAEMKIMRAGMKVTLSTKGKLKHEASIVFPLMQNLQQQSADSLQNNDSNQNHNQVFNKETFRRNFITKHTTMQANGFANINGIVPVKNSLVQLAVNWDSASNFIYEIAIAKNEFFGANYSVREALAEITLSVEINGLQHAEDAKIKGGMKAGNEGMHKPRNGNGFNQERYHLDDEKPLDPLNKNNNIPLSSKTSFKQKFVLNSVSSQPPVQ